MWRSSPTGFRGKLPFNFTTASNNLVDIYPTLKLTIRTAFSAKLNEYKQKVAHLKELRKNMSASDSEEELDTSDVFILAQKNHELDDIVSSLKTMEDPQMRYAVL